MSMHDYHVHLFGCITAEILWEKYRSDPKRLQHPRYEWFETEYLRLTGRPSPFRRLLTDDRGFAEFKCEYQVTRPVHFPEFQARFNLIVAAHSDRANDGEVLQQVSRTLAATQVTGADYRIFVPLAMNDSELEVYLLRLSDARAQTHRKLGFAAELFLHLSREPATGKQQWRQVRKILAKHQDLVQSFAGTDFCEDEQAFHPGSYQWLAEDWQQDGKPGSHWTLSCHAGEVCDRVGPLLAIDRLSRIVESGFERIGHASILGIPSERWLGETITMSDEHLAELKQSRLDGVDQVTASVQRGPQGQQLIQFDRQTCDIMTSWQKAVLATMRDQGVAIESCPTSNRILGSIQKEAFHPLEGLAKSQVRIMIGSDDPGLFGCTLADELEHFAKFAKERSKSLDPL